MPPLLKHHRTPEGLNLRYRDRVRNKNTWQYVVAIYVMTILIGYYAHDELSSTASWTLFLTGSIFITAFFLLRDRRRMVVNIGRKSLTVSSGVLIPRLRHWFPVGNIRQLYTARRPEGHQGDISFYLAARLADGTDLLIIEHTENIAVLTELEAAIERELDLLDEPLLSLSDTGQTTAEMERAVEIFEVAYEREAARSWPTKSRVYRAQQQLEGARKALARQYDRLG